METVAFETVMYACVLYFGNLLVLHTHHVNKIYSNLSIFVIPTVKSKNSLTTPHKYWINEIALKCQEPSPTYMQMSTCGIIRQAKWLNAENNL